MGGNIKLLNDKFKNYLLINKSRFELVSLSLFLYLNASKVSNILIIYSYYKNIYNPLF